MERISDIIKDEYMNWERGSIILITGQTGSGKSYFILNKLLPLVINIYFNNGINCKILYLVNRKILKEQLIEDLRKLENEWANHFSGTTISIFDFIEIETYQQVEKKLRTTNNLLNIINWLNYYYYIVYDECHYFYNDANFNTYTELSYDFFRTESDQKIQIFMSATMENMKEIIPERPKSSHSYVHDVKRTNRMKEYSSIIDYSYIDIQVLESLENFFLTIKENLEDNNANKWLIFVDSIDEGKKMQKDLLDGLTKSNDSNSKKAIISKEDIVFIDAQYKLEEEADKTVQQIAKQKYAKEKIIITTAVMDNGISFHDEELRNIVIMADTKESFIQMLGRKRQDNNKVTLYILKRDISHFTKRLQYVNKIIDFFYENRSYINTMYSTQEGVILSPYMALKSNLCTYAELQQRALESLLKNESYGNKIIYPLCGRIAINSFAIQRCKQLAQFYQKMIEELKKDANAFIIEQFKWLVKNKENVEQALKSLDQKHYENIYKLLESKIGYPLKEKENKDLKKELREDLAYFIKKDTKYDENLLRKATRTDATLAEKTFNGCMNLINLDFVMKKKDGKFIILKKEIGEKS